MKAFSGFAERGVTRPAAAALLATLALLSVAVPTAGQSINATENASGNGSENTSAPTGSSEYQAPDYLVRSGDRLARLDETAPAGSVIVIPGNTTLTVEPGAVTFDQPGITVRSTGGKFGRGGAVIRQQGKRGGWEYGEAVLSFRGPRSTVAGLRFIGPFPQGDRGSGEGGSPRPASAAVVFAGDNSTVYNSEFAGWTRAGVVFEESSGSHAFLSSFHDNYSPDIGYGVQVRRSDATIEYSYFNRNRHGIASQRDAVSSYVARGNVVGGDRPNHAFDVHGASRSSRSHGGGRIVIVNNTFLPPANNSDGPAANAIRFRGAEGPTAGGVVANNLFLEIEASKALGQSREGSPPQEIASAATPSALIGIEWRGNAIVESRAQAPRGVGAPASMPAPSQIPGATGAAGGSVGILAVASWVATILVLGVLVVMLALGLGTIALLEHEGGGL